LKQLNRDCQRSRTRKHWSRVFKDRSDQLAGGEE